MFAGPNGSGKSTITEAYPIEGIYVNADEIKKVRKCTDLEAAVEAEQIREDCLQNGRSFTFETVLSTERNLEFLSRAKQAGFHITGVFVLTSDPEINVFRVRSRVLDGGHDVPCDKIRSRYEKSLKNICKLAKLSNQFRIYDNTAVPEIILFMAEQKFEICENKYWPKARIEELICEYTIN